MTSSHQTADTRGKEFDLRYSDWRVVLAACLGVIFRAKSWALHT
jgi:hypothetical protein